MRIFGLVIGIIGVWLASMDIIGKSRLENIENRIVATITEIIKGIHEIKNKVEEKVNLGIIKKHLSSEDIYTLGKWAAYIIILSIIINFVLPVSIREQVLTFSLLVLLLIVIIAIQFAMFNAYFSFLFGILMGLFIMIEKTIIIFIDINLYFYKLCILIKNKLHLQSAIILSGLFLSTISIILLSIY